MYIIYIVDYMMIMCCVFLQSGWTALHTAAMYGQVDIVNLLLTNNPDLISQTDNVSEQIIQLLYSKCN